MEYFKIIELVYEPRTVALATIDSKNYQPEMTQFESAFLSGVIKTIRPKKVVEIGVAAGATSAIILESLESFSDEYICYSLDLRAKFNKDSSKSTGFLSSQYKEKKPLLKGIHEIITGKFAVESADLIGNKVDLLIIDTVHTLPGEILDFLAFYPMMSEDGMIILHDISLNHNGNYNNKRSYATKILFDVIEADKYLNFDSSEHYLIPNIAAFRLNGKTRESIIKVISSLSLTWEYLPNTYELNIYHKFYENHYDEYELDFYNKVINRQLKTLVPKTGQGNYHEVFVKANSLIWWIFKIKRGARFLLKHGFKMTLLTIKKNILN